MCEVWLGSSGCHNSHVLLRRLQAKSNHRGFIQGNARNLLEGSFPGSSVVKNLPADAGNARDTPLGRKSPWRRAWQPTPVFLPEESHGQRSLAGCSPRGRKESDMTGAHQGLVAVRNQEA